MQKFLKIGALALASSALCGGALAAPTTMNIEFEGADVAGRNFNGGDNFMESNFTFTAQDPWGSGFAGFGVAAGDSCAFLTCPARSSAYYATTNDGSLKMQSNGGLVRLAGFDAGFVAEVQPWLYGPDIGQIVVTGEYAGGTMVETFQLDGISFADNQTSFAHFDFSAAFANTFFSNVTFAACTWDSPNAPLCTAGDSFGQGRLALDAIQVIPEPSSYALVGLGLLAAFGTRRRRAA